MSTYAFFTTIACAVVIGICIGYVIARDKWDD